ncbi:hypothetical protein SARC_14541, partial [Sphaeroforma arctica JP610]
PNDSNTQLCILTGYVVLNYMVVAWLLIYYKLLLVYLEHRDPSQTNSSGSGSGSGSGQTDHPGLPRYHLS